MSAPKRVQRRRTKGWRMPSGSVYVGRPTKWGSPFVVGAVADRYALGCILTTVVKDRANSVELYREWINDPRRAYQTGFRATVPTELDLSELRGRDLVCWCPLDQPCHADVLLELANPKAAGTTAGVDG